MIKKGYQLTCSGCGIHIFVESNIAPRPLNLHDGVEVVNYNQNQSESWVKVHKVFDLCPTCEKIHEKMLCRFYEECGKARVEKDERS